MKPTISGIFAAAMIVLLAASCGNAGEFPRPSISLVGRLNTPTISTQGGVVYLQMSIVAPTLTVIPHRRPLNLSVVLDRSGSMGDERKIEYAKKALTRLVDQLDAEDILSIVIYDDVVEVLREARRVGNDRSSIQRLVENIYPRGSTNLGGGMVQGLRQVEHHLRSDCINRVVLLSDGLANQGITDPYELNTIARQYRAKRISLTTMGVGLDYNENLMVGLAENGGGNYYFIESPNSLASILNKEFNMLSTVVAQNASIELTLGRNVTVRDVIGCDYHLQSDRYVVPVGDLSSNECRDFTVELLVPPGTGSLTVATGVLRYDSEQKWGDGFPTFTASVCYTKDVALIEKERDLKVQAKADIAVSTRTVDHAMKALDEGRAAEAAQDLETANRALSASPAASSGAGGAMLREQAAKLESFGRLLKDTSDARKAKKMIQYDNYRTQKSK
ncbi:MAG TPA: VWA domain-containing protein [Bacteroidota bacterium]